MNLNEPSVELDFAVAEAVGIEATVKKFKGIPGTCYRIEGDSWIPFRPSADMTDAWEAMERELKCRRERTPALRDGVGVLFSLMRRGPDGFAAQFYPPSSARFCTHAPTGPLAICGAILKSKENP